MITITKEIMRQGRSSQGGYSAKQLRVLGVETTHNNKGWFRRLIGTIITEQQKIDFLALKDKHLCPKHPTLW